MLHGQRGQLHGALCPLLPWQGILERSVSNPGKVYFCCAMVNPSWELILFNVYVCATQTSCELTYPEAWYELLLLEGKKGRKAAGNCSEGLHKLC